MRFEMTALELISLVINVIQNEWDPDDLALGYPERGDCRVKAGPSETSRRIRRPSPAVLRAIYDMIIEANLEWAARSSGRHPDHAHGSRS